MCNVSDGAPATMGTKNDSVKKINGKPGGKFHIFPHIIYKKSFATKYTILYNLPMFTPTIGFPKLSVFLPNSYVRYLVAYICVNICSHHETEQDRNIFIKRNTFVVNNECFKTENFKHEAKCK